MDPSPYPPVERGPHNHIGVAPSAYKERLYRSMLEARVARFVDMYFPGGLYEDGPELPGLEVARTRDGRHYGYRLRGRYRYRPDFWLPTVRTFLEAKGASYEASLWRPVELARLVAPLGVQVAVATRRSGSRFDFYVVRGGKLWPAALCRCPSCGARYFHAGGPTDCRACGVVPFTGSLSPSHPKEDDSI